MGKQYRAYRQIGSLAIQPGGSNTIDLPRDYDYEAIGLRIVATVNVTVSGVAVRAEAPCQLVPRIEVVSNGKNTLYSAPFWFASLGNVWRKHTDNGGRATTPPSGFAIASYNVEATGLVDFMTPDSIHPKDSNYRSRFDSILQLRLTYGQPMDMYTGGTGTLTGTPVVEVWAMQCVEEEPQPNVFTSWPEVLKKVSYQEAAILASNPSQEFKLPAGNAIRGVLMRTSGATTVGEPDVLTLNSLTLSAGMDVRHKLSGPQIRATNNAQFGAVTPGYYVADFMRAGHANTKLADCWDVSGVTEPKAIADVVGSANRFAQLVIIEYLPAAKPATK